MAQRQRNPTRSEPTTIIPRGGDIIANTNPRKHSTFLPLALLDAVTNPFLKSTLICFVCNAVGFLISLTTGSHVHLDLIGTGAFALAALPNIASTIPHIQISSWAQGIWATKLASFLFFRATQVGHDKRLEEMLLTTKGTFGFWAITLVWQVLCSLPYTMGISSSTYMASPLVLKAGAMLYGVGLLIETFADGQKYFFKQAHPGQFTNVGLWSISQHPNFFGNLVLWAGIFVMNAPAMIDPLPKNVSLWKRIWACRRLVVSLLGPWFMWTLFSGQAKGTLSKTMELASSKYGNDPAYRKYIEQVPLIIPKLFKS
jgi:steroid 5-alpha reductase family enzyme